MLYKSNNYILKTYILHQYNCFSSLGASYEWKIVVSNKAALGLNRLNTAIDAISILRVKTNINLLFFFVIVIMINLVQYYMKKTHSKLNYQPGSLLLAPLDPLLSLLLQ